MRRSKKNRNRRRGAFTLLEVLLVVGIIALLAAAVVPSFLGTEKRAKMELARSGVDEGGAIGSAISLFQAHMKRYPEELSELFETPEDEEEADKWSGPYITDMEKLKDPWGNPYQYLGPEEAEHNEGKYDLWSTGPDEDDDEDDIPNWKVE